MQKAFIFKRFFKNFKSFQSFRRSSQDLRRKFALAASLFIVNSAFKFSKIVFFDEPKEEVTPEKVKKISGLGRLKKYELGPSKDINEGDIREYFIGENGEISILVMRFKGRLYATNAICTYDGKTSLKDGILFENKLYCPIHGCAFNITTGSTEYGPARDYLPKYFCFEKEGKITVMAPETPIKRVLPPCPFRDYNDLRKVVIIGSSAAAQGCIETLKETGFTGEITVITKDVKFPYDKTRLTKGVTDLDYKNIQLRDEEWYKKAGVTFLFGKEVETVDNTHGAPNIVLQDGVKIEYDALLIATGVSSLTRPLKGYGGQENLLYLRDVHDHKLLKEKLLSQGIKKICLIGLNMKSLEMASTIRKEFPNVEVTLVDENKKSLLEGKFGKEVFDAFLNLHLNNGVAFLLKAKIKELIGDEKDIKKITFFDGNEIEADAFIAFPNNVIANTDFTMDAETLDNLSFDDEGRIKTNVNQRSDHKRVFAAGDCSSTFYYVNNFQIPCENWNFAYHQGMISAYNILALNIPLHMTNFAYSQHYDKTIQYIGYFPYYEEEHIVGDLQNFDFISFYGVKDQVVAVCGTQGKDNRMLILNEAYRLNLMPSFSDWKSGKVTIKDVENQIRVDHEFKIN